MSKLQKRTNYAVAKNLRTKGYVCRKQKTNKKKGTQTSKGAEKEKKLQERKKESKLSRQQKRTKEKQKSKQKRIEVQNTCSSAGRHFVAKFAAFLLVHFRQKINV